MDYTALRNAGVYVNTCKNRSFSEEMGRVRSLRLSKPFNEGESLKNKTPQYNNGVLCPRRTHSGFQKLLSEGGGAL